jgi:hypothetical protein
VPRRGIMPDGHCPARSQVTTVADQFWHLQFDLTCVEVQVEVQDVGAPRAADDPAPHRPSLGQSQLRFTPDLREPEYETPFCCPTREFPIIWWLQPAYWTRTTLDAVRSQSNPWSADCYISQFVQDGSTHVGKFRLVAGHNITEMTLRVDVNHASAAGTVLVEFFCSALP